MKLNELRQEMVKRFCDEHDFWYGVPGDAAVIEKGCCTQQEYFRFQVLKCIGYCNFCQYSNTADMNRDPEGSYSDIETDFDYFDALIKSKLRYAKGDRQDAYLWATNCLRTIQLELFDRQTDIATCLQRFDSNS